MSALRKLLQRVSQGRHHLLQRPGLRWLEPLLDQPACWALNRRKVARGVALGLATGLLPGPPKRLSTLLLAFCLKVNVPAALLATLYSNPLTILPLYFLAYSCGLLLLGDPTTGTMSQPPLWENQTLWQWGSQLLNWLLLLGWPLLLGLLVLGLLLSVTGYVLVMLGWRWVVVRNWKKRKAARGSC
ncbi:DUF2062 domain-containing protein [Aquitalea sp. LB_tupeE]|uniref:DUF2062 domain-containing protein n=1 Tax=Aquitalea sp. LB_tupeE TaxID=2748078 RepID=UPI0015BC1881|nr:DUF2062 domain-containing protein [Aquitalea sp. LB_tupeE]NWK76618.1 DUF2062 domain-containing protein [Aquitalea sp. LB_tupeE]